MRNKLARNELTEGRTRVPDLYIDGAWATARAGGRREIRCPADGTLVAEVDEATEADTEAAATAPGRPRPAASGATCC